MRLLWARIGVPHCPMCGERIQRQTVQQIADQLMELPEGTRYQVLAPGGLAEEGRVRRPLPRARGAGLLARGRRRRGDPARRAAHAEEAGTSTTSRSSSTGSSPAPTCSAALTDSLETALRLTDGLVQVNFVDETGPAAWAVLLREARRARTGTRSSSPRSSRARSRSTRRSAPAPSARASARACRSTPTCCSATRALSIDEGVILPWTTQGKGLYNYYERLLEGLARDLGFSLDTPWEELDRRGAATPCCAATTSRSRCGGSNRYGREMSYTSGFEGVVPYIERQYLQAETDVAARSAGPSTCARCRARSATASG